MTILSPRRLGLAALPLALLASGPHPLRVQPDSTAVAEAAYAHAIAALADSVIRQLDVLPARAQLRVQTAFLDPARASTVPFGDLARAGGAGGCGIDY
jgi:hypothetical protein